MYVLEFDTCIMYAQAIVGEGVSKHEWLNGRIGTIEWTSNTIVMVRH